jgi:tyrosyl-tRNA synthetase
MDAALKGGSVIGYCGFDPTADSLHVGSLLPIMGLLHLQRSNNRPVALIGGGTGLIGDPSGKTAERQLLDRDIIEHNAARIRAQIEPFLGNGPYSVANNVEWLGRLNLIEFLRDIGKHFSVNVMLQRDSVASRMENGISFTEFSYMLLQAYDYLELHRRYGVNLQIGGSDQYGNIVAGVDLIRRITGDTVHGQTMHLVTTASGTKFGKTEAGAVWLDPAKTSPYQFYQFWINIEDRDVGKYLRYFTLLDQDRIRELDIRTATSPQRREAQRALARDATTRVHGAKAAGIAEGMSELLFGGTPPTELSVEFLAALSAEIPSADVESMDVVEMLVAAKLVPSKGAARRLAEQGGVYVNNKRYNPTDGPLASDQLLPGQRLLLRKGARDYALVRVKSVA